MPSPCTALLPWPLHPCTSFEHSTLVSKVPGGAATCQGAKAKAKATSALRHSTGITHKQCLQNAVIFPKSRAARATTATNNSK